MEKEYSIKKVLKNSSIYGFTTVLQKALSFFLLPLYTVYLIPSDYGLVALISTFMGFIALLITLALNGAISRFYFVYKHDETKVKEFLGTIIVGVILNCMLWFLLILGFKDIITSTFLKNIAFFPYVFLALLSTVTSPIYIIYQSILQIKQEARLFSINSMSYFILAVSLNLLFIVVFKLGATGLLLANAIPNILFSLIAIINLLKRKHIVIMFKWPYMAESLRYSLPLIPHMLSGTIADYISKSILNIKSNLANVGLFNIAFQFGSILDIIQSSINSAFIPMLYNTLGNQKDEEWKIINITTLIFKVVCFLGLGIALFSKEIVVLMTSNVSFHIAWKAIPIIVFGALFQSLYLFYSNLLFYNRKATRYIWIASLSGNTAHIAFSIWFTALFLYITPAIAGVIQRIIMFIIVYYISRKLQPVKFELLKMLGIILLFIFSATIALAPDAIIPTAGLSFTRFSWKVLVFILTVAILFYKDRLLLKTQLNKLVIRSKN